jgi:hypothetical protein
MANLFVCGGGMNIFWRDFGGVNFWFVACGWPMMSALFPDQTALGKQVFYRDNGLYRGKETILLSST